MRARSRPQTWTVALAALAACAPGPSAARRPNVVLVTLDTTRADKLGCYGYYRDTTPALDALAAESLVFERCLAPVSQTLPSHASLFTGLQPLEHGLLANLREELAYELAPGAVPVAELFREHGYRTAAFIAAEPLKRECGLEAGFDDWSEPAERHARAGEVVDPALAWLAAPAPAPFFLWVHLFDPHLPYEPPPPYDALFGPDETQAAYLAERRCVAGTRRYATPRAHDLYDGELRYLDAELAKLLDALRARPDWHATVVVVVGDHGEELMQHGDNGHGRLWDVSLRVPLIARIPGVAPGRESRPIGMVDVLPTVFARVEGFPERFADWQAAGSGRDVLSLEVAARPFLGILPLEGRRPPGYALEEGRWKLVVERGREQLYDLAADPHELEDRAAEHPEVVARLRERLAELRAEQVARGRALGAGVLHTANPERRRGLEELGYGGGEDSSEDER